MQKKSLENKHTLTISTKSDQSTKTRRRLLLGLGGVTATAYLPSQWKKPLIDSIVVPAHAQATGPAQGETTTTTQEPLPTVFYQDGIEVNLALIEIQTKLKSQPWYAKALQLGMSNAKAGNGAPLADGEIRFSTSDNQESIEEIIFNPSSSISTFMFSGSQSVGSAFDLANPCSRDDIQVTVNSINNNELSYTINFFGQIITRTAPANDTAITINNIC